MSWITAWSVGVRMRITTPYPGWMGAALAGVFATSLSPLSPILSRTVLVPVVIVTVVATCAALVSSALSPTLRG